jgi:hypothetical protein
MRNIADKENARIFERRCNATFFVFIIPKATANKIAVQPFKIA